MPNPTLFPMESMSITLKDGSVLEVKGKDMEEALQYSSSVRFQRHCIMSITNTPLSLFQYGLTRLVEWLKEFQKKTHNPPYGIIIPQHVVE